MLVLVLVLVLVLLLVLSHAPAVLSVESLPAGGAEGRVAGAREGRAAGRGRRFGEGLRALAGPPRAAGNRRLGVLGGEAAPFARVVDVIEVIAVGRHQLRGGHDVGVAPFAVGVGEVGGLPAAAGRDQVEAAAVGAGGRRLRAGARARRLPLVDVHAARLSFVPEAAAFSRVDVGGDQRVGRLEEEPPAVGREVAREERRAVDVRQVQGQDEQAAHRGVAQRLGPGRVAGDAVERFARRRVAEELPAGPELAFGAALLGAVLGPGQRPARGEGGRLPVGAHPRGPRGEERPVARAPVGVVALAPAPAGQRGDEAQRRPGSRFPAEEVGLAGLRDLPAGAGRGAGQRRGRDEVGAVARFGGPEHPEHPRAGLEFLPRLRGQVDQLARFDVVAVEAFGPFASVGVGGQLGQRLEEDVAPVGGRFQEGGRQFGPFRAFPVGGDLDAVRRGAAEAEADVELAVAFAFFFFFGARFGVEGLAAVGGDRVERLRVELGGSAPFGRPAQGPVVRGRRSRLRAAVRRLRSRRPG